MIPKKCRKLYTVYNNKTDLPVIIDGNARECAVAMGITLSSFRSCITLTRPGGRLRKWTILSRLIEPEERK